MVMSQKGHNNLVEKNKIVSESDILGSNGYFSDILYRLKGTCLNIPVLNTELKYAYYLCQYHRFEIHALNYYVNYMTITV